MEQSLAGHGPRAEGYPREAAARHLWGDAPALLARGRLLVVPTDTVYGMVCDPTDSAAVERLYAAKARPAGLELPVLGADLDALAELVELSPAARRAAAVHWPGPLTIVARLREPLRLAVPRAGTSLAVRVPAHPLLRSLLWITGPLASSSANPHGVPAPAHAAEAVGILGNVVAAAYDGGPAAGRASTIIDCTASPPRVLRVGALSEADLRPHLEG
ncbi:MAG: L-threonylcarbamoyladenylate synthase [Candidatus Dormibacteria bacterium]